MEPGQGLWKKRILVPFWIVRICIMVFVIAAYAYTLRSLRDLEDFTEPAAGYARAKKHLSTCIY